MRARPLVLALCVLAVAVIAACGGGGEGKKPAPPVATPGNGPGGTVGERPTVGRLGPSEIVGPGGTKVTGIPGPMSPTARKPSQTELSGVGSTVACASATATPSSSNMGTVAGAILCLLNNERANKGLAPLHLNASLTKASKRMAVLMVRKRFFAHDTPDGKSLLDRVKPTGYVRGRWQLGENLAWGNGGLDVPRAIVNSWMHSKGHKANILHGAFKDIGIGITLGPPSPSVSGGATYVTDFGRHG